MKLPRYDDVPVFGQDFLVPRRQKAQYRGMFRCMGFSIVLVVTFLLSSACLLTGVYLLYPVDPPEAANFLVLVADADPETQNFDTPIESRPTAGIMIIRIDPQREQISVLSIPPSIFINVPSRGRTRANSIINTTEEGQPGRGLDIMQESIENTFDLQIHHVIYLDFKDLAELIDAVDGVEVVVPIRFQDAEYELPDEGGTTVVTFAPGLQWMNGERVIEYVRANPPDGTIDRETRLQQVLDGLFLKMNTSRGVMRLPILLAAMGQHTDSDLSIDDGLRYVPGILHYAPNGLQTQIITSEYILNEGGIDLPNVITLDPWLEDHLRPVASDTKAQQPE